MNYYILQLNLGSEQSARSLTKYEEKEGSQTKETIDVPVTCKEQDLPEER